MKLQELLTRYGKPLKDYTVISWEQAINYPTEKCVYCDELKEILRHDNPEFCAVLFNFHIVGMMA
ncbi:MAG TPA: hypothetical protein VEP90_15040 [Methylomirabilota bacterium]|nr:hypothetical protein [Methylomirabilota bacterium]